MSGPVAIPPALTRAQVIAYILAADGEGSGLEADIVMARRPRAAGQSFNSFPNPSSGIAADAFSADTINARASLGA